MSDWWIAVTDKLPTAIGATVEVWAWPMHASNLFWRYRVHLPGSQLHRKASPSKGRKGGIVLFSCSLAPSSPALINCGSSRGSSCKNSRSILQTGMKSTLPRSCSIAIKYKLQNARAKGLDHLQMNVDIFADREKGLAV
jgi:hypothetical protein